MDSLNSVAGMTMTLSLQSELENILFIFYVEKQFFVKSIESGVNSQARTMYQMHE